MTNDIYKNTSQYQSIKQITTILLLCIISHFAGVAVPTAYANEVGLKIAPSVFQIQSQIPGEVQTPFTIENQSSDPITLKIGYKIINKLASQEGIVTFLNDTDASTSTNKAIFDQIQVIDEDNNSRDVVELGPKQKKKLMLRINLPKEIPTTDYYFSLIFAHDNPLKTDQTQSYIDASGQKSVAAIQTGIALNIFLSTGPISYPQGNISEFSTPFYTQSGPIAFTAKVTNVGNHYITPKGEVIIKNIFGQKIQTITIPPTLVLSGTTRSLTDNLRHTSENLQIPQITWPQKLLMGFYTATLQLSLSPEGPFYTQSIQFIVFPMIPLLVILFSIPFAIFIFIRIKRKL